MNSEQWLLPEGVVDILPDEAQSLERMRRSLLDLYHRWGYELVIPPLLEFTHSLLSGVGSDLDLLTLKVTDQLSGRLMGLRADITPQVARIDAHSYIREGVNRLCYTDHVFRAKPKSPLKVRIPLQAGVELFGEPGIEADLEVMSLLIESLEQLAVPSITVDIGHVGIFRGLAQAAYLDSADEIALLALLQTKDSVDIEQWVKQRISDPQLARWLCLLPTLRGGIDVLDKARQNLQGAPAEIFAAMDEIMAIHRVINERYPKAGLYVDLGELRGYHYHTGIVFAAYAEGFGDTIANGGRYDHIGEAFGRSRPATGFGINISALLSLLAQPSAAAGIFAPASEDKAQWQAVQKLRAQGERVVCGLSEQTPNDKALNCDRLLALQQGDYCVKPL